jgi:hypothetical protein
MTDTTFVNGVTLTDQGWFNDTNAAVYRGVVINPVTVTANTTLTVNNNFVRADGTSSGFTITLMASPPDGKQYVIKKVDSSSNVIIISGNGINIDGSASLSITNPNDSITLIYHTTWNSI